MEGAQCDGAAFGGSGGLGPGTASMSFADVLRGSAVDRGLDLGSEARGAAAGGEEEEGDSTQRAVPDEAARVGSSSTHQRRRLEEADAEAAASKKKKTRSVCPHQPDRAPGVGLCPRLSVRRRPARAPSPVVRRALMTWKTGVRSA